MTLHCQHHRKSDSNKRFRPVASCIRPLRCKLKNQEQCREVMCRIGKRSLCVFEAFWRCQISRTEKWMRFSSSHRIGGINRVAQGKICCWYYTKRIAAALLEWRQRENLRNRFVRRHHIFAFVGVDDNGELINMLPKQLIFKEDFSCNDTVAYRYWGNMFIWTN